MRFFCVPVIWRRFFDGGVATLPNWEQGRRKPEGAANVLLRIIDTNPQAITQLAIAC
jgi:DNA-binding transcriptional regulator YiaG